MTTPVCCKCCGAFCARYLFVCDACALMNFKVPRVLGIGSENLPTGYLPPKKRFAMGLKGYARKDYRPKEVDVEKARDVRRAKKFEGWSRGSRKITQYFKKSDVQKTCVVRE